MRSPGNARKPKIWPVSLSQNSAKISGQSLHAFSGKCPETFPDGRTDGQTDGQTDGHAVKRLRLVGWTNGPMYRSKEGISGFGRTDGRTDGQPENIMPPAPKGGGIIEFFTRQLALRSRERQYRDYPMTLPHSKRPVARRPLAWTVTASRRQRAGGKDEWLGIEYSSLYS